MAATPAPVTHESRTDVPTGYQGQRFTAPEVRTYRVDVTYPPFPCIYVQTPDGRWAHECGRCGGSGNYGSGPHNGICYSCNGIGLRHLATASGGLTDTQLDSVITAWAKRAAATSRRTEREVAAATAERTDWRTENAALVAWAQGLAPSRVDRNVGSYVRGGATRAAAETPDNQADRLVSSWEMDDGTWTARFAIDEERFTKYGYKADDMISRVRAGAALEANETRYLAVVQERDTTPVPTAEQTARAAASRHAGDAGQRVEIIGIAAESREWVYQDGGTSWFVVVEGTGQHAGLTLKTWTGAASAYGVEPGDAVRVRATIRRNDERDGIKQDVVNRPVFTVMPLAEAQAAAAPAPRPQPAPQESSSVPQKTPRTAPRTGRRPAQGASSVPGWELLYDKPRAGAEVVRQGSAYALACKTHKTLRPLDRLTDEGSVRKQGGWCSSCTP